MYVLIVSGLGTVHSEIAIIYLYKIFFRFLISLKLFLVMGISWIFEIASFAHGGEHIIW